MRGTSSVVIVAVVLAVAAGDRHQTELKEHYDHLAYIAEFNCHKPQARVISVHELFPEKDTAHKAFFPDVTVLHRCDNAVGCCPSNHVCRPKHTHPLHLPFKVTFLEHMGKHKKGSWIIDYHTFDNHTECECVDASVCVPPTEEHHEPNHHSEPPHKPDHHGEPHHEPDHHSEPQHKPDHHEPDHHSEPHHKPDHHEPEHHVESSHKTEHHSESHHEEEHHIESSHHQGESHHEPDHHGEESNHKPDYHTESSHKSEQHSSSYQPDSKSAESSPGPIYSSENPSSVSPEDRPSESSSPQGNNEQQESSTLPLLVNYVLNTTSTSTTESTDVKDLSSFFD